MKELNFDDGLFDDDDEEDIEEEFDEGVGASRYKIVVEFSIKADDIDEAEGLLKEVIDHGIVSMMEQEDKEPVRSYDITDSDIEEVF